ncbi:methionyl-tRNA formyltransferase [Branchiibius hedensis]|uniref:Methionyl-tRNA formyltransferase n=1 Tax=Branchiibius hedensis TaxID=672460 RepID=A0A2Y8ZRT7_9MICO|nr:methionyl-tRNA formyltransferase [Branchiibius hedensis]PWJ25332.1 methionyl-tRNA formyltransferase [Branchiibius hedensis]SSA34146.1 methionyl-tRNA formyltransferase [Branchiibius hedensis]
MRVVFAGTPEAAVPSLQAILRSRHEVLAVLTRPDAPAGRGRSTRRSPVGQVADEAGIPVLTPGRPREVAGQLRELNPDACPVVAYGALLPGDLLAIPQHGWINLHFSLLPAWRGAAPVQHAIAHGDEVTGATTFVIDEGMDTGPVLGRMTAAIGRRETSGDLLERLAVTGADLLVATLDALESGALEPDPQPYDGVSLAPKITVDDARIDWGTPAFAVDRHVRAMTPAPGAWTTFRGERLKILPVSVAEEELAPGVLRVGKRTVLVGTATQAVELGQVQAVGKKVMDAAAWARGVRDSDGEVLGG